MGLAAGLVLGLAGLCEELSCPGVGAGGMAAGNVVPDAARGVLAAVAGTAEVGDAAAGDGAIPGLVVVVGVML